LKESIAETSVGGVVYGQSDEKTPPGVVASFGVHLGKVECVVVLVGIRGNASENVLYNPFEVLWFVAWVAGHEERV
jgi:hypothetical protein